MHFRGSRIISEPTAGRGKTRSIAPKVLDSPRTLPLHCCLDHLAHDWQVVRVTTALGARTIAAPGLFLFLPTCDSGLADPILASSDTRILWPRRAAPRDGGPGPGL